MQIRDFGAIGFLDVCEIGAEYPVEVQPHCRLSRDCKARRSSDDDCVFREPGWALRYGKDC